MAVFTDNWRDLKYKGAESNEIDRIGVINDSKLGVEIINEWVGFGDEWDYKEFTLDSAANLSFNITASDAVKFNIYSLTEKVDRQGNTTYSLKQLQSTALKLDKSSGQYVIDTKNLLLTGDTYYIGVQSTNAKKGGNADYTVSLNDLSVFYTQGNNADDWTDLKTKGASGEVGSLGDITEDNAKTFSDSDWVGFGDEWDYKKFTLDSAANLSFNITASDAVKFNIYSLTEKVDRQGNTTYSLKQLQSTALKLDKSSGQYVVDTKNLLLTGDTYYIGVQSTNAKKGGNADYTVSLNDSSVFYTKGDDGSNDWLYDSKSKIFNDDDNIEYVGSIGVEDPISIEGDDKWVGFGDSTDYYRFSVDTDMNVSFSISATDAVKLTVYQVINGKVKSLLPLTAKAGVPVSSSKLALKADGEYYLAIQSTNAAKGGSADYTVTGSFYVTQLNLTISGINDSLFEDYFYGAGCDDSCEGEEDHYENCIPDKAKIGKIIGSDAADTVTFAANVSRCIEGIDLGKGNDKIIAKDSSNADDDNSEIQNPHWVGKPSFISLGDGDDSLYLGNYHDLECSGLDFGSGNDILTIGRESEVGSIGGWGEGEGVISLGDGNDKIIGGVDSELDSITIDFGSGNDSFESKTGMEITVGNCDFGSGDDTMIIVKNSLFELANYSDDGTIDFGFGDDTLVLNGTLHFQNVPNIKISGLEKLSGSGYITFASYAGEDVEVDENLIAMADKAGIEIVNLLDLDLVGSGYEWHGAEQELGDNTRDGKYVETLDRRYHDDAEFWLCGEDAAESVDCGFADSVDYIKFVKTSDCEVLYVSASCIDGNGDMNGFSCQILNSAGEVEWNWPQEDYFYCDSYIDIEDWKNGTYYLKFASSADSAYAGYVELD